MGTPPPSSWAVHVVDTGDTVLLQISGDLDLSTAPRLDEVLSPLHARRCELDLSDVRFTDSTGVNLLVKHQHHAVRAGGGLRLIAVTRAVRRVLDITGTSATLLGGTGKPSPPPEPGSP